MEAPRTVDEVYANFSRRRDGLVTALTRGTIHDAKSPTDSRDRARIDANDDRAR
jgi:hypothetical protein